MGEQWHDEKEEKQEKEDEKRYEKQEKEEKSWDEKWRHDPLGTIVWAVILIWAGLVLFASQFGVWDSLNDFLARQLRLEVVNLGPWAVILFGAGLIVLVEVIIRLLVPEYRRPVGGSIIFIMVVIGAAIGMIWDWRAMGGLILIGIGAGIILDSFIRGRQGPGGDSPKPGA
ncbi:MAG: hypothetical protein JXA37_12920 [Chloroflexia bacterium]|nr:hypothetical protein [Chloroflexia bacterium]